MKIRLLWITDPWKTLDHPCDTSLRLMEEGVKKGVPTFWCDVTSIRLENDQILADVRPLVKVAAGRAADSFTFGKTRTTSPAGFSRIIYRTDPPVDLHYLLPLQMLCLATIGRSGCEVINAPEILCCSSEKIEGCGLDGLSAPAIASSNAEALERFGRCHGRTVLKPLYQAQSKGVHLLNWKSARNTRESRKSLREATRGFTEPVLLQKYLKGVHQGELRLWFLNGSLLAFGRKVPKTGEFKIDMDRGGRLVPATLSAADRRAASRIGRHLKARKIRLAAVDLIDGFITDFNYTSPGLLVELERISGKNLAETVIEGLLPNVVSKEERLPKKYPTKPSCSVPSIPV